MAVVAKKDTKLQDDVRKLSTKLGKCLRGIEFEERTQILNLDSLSCRIDKGKMKNPETFKMWMIRRWNYN